ncbi:hypothetical protein [Leptothoe spongobia]|uniref:Uncharacterized protein n=1 Tax=Leptothoe spongobia TAU-MAC 1115 TaxID=1967444 RepID=A0A947DH53_9CYAN|nr:hypothetical protein [Leptothoe spongobia]MBT9316982.1 hypothetical protein [Leptothoe spongobia TAU-MAC 1115]
MDRESLLKFARYAFYTILVGGLLYVLIPMDLPTLQSSIIKTELQQLTVLIIVALFLERALEVYKLFYFSPEKERLAAQVEKFQLELGSLLTNADDSANDKRIQAAKISLFNAEESLRIYKNHMRQSLLKAAIVFGLLIGLVGVRSLEGAFNFPGPESVLEIFRLYLFRVLDLILTAGLIAGGSEGIHNVIKKIGNLFPDVQKKVIDFVQAIKQNPV